MKYAILGGGGSFGLHTAKYLLAQSDTERVLSIGRSPPKPPCFRMGIGDGDARYSYIPLHITYDHVSVLKLFKFEKPDVIINFAAQGEGATSFTESWRYFETNCVGLSRLVESLIGKTWLKKFIHIGTSECYGSTDTPADETAPISPSSPYAISKVAFDAYLIVVAGKYDFPAVIVRPSNCYGEGQQLHRFIPKAFLCGFLGAKMPLHGGGKAEKSYLHSEDLARAIYLLAQSGDGGVYNVGPHDPTPMIEVARLVAETMCLDVQQLFEPSPDRDHQDSRYWLDSSKIRERGWQPQVFWREGLTRTMKWVKDNLEELKHQPIDFVMRP